MSAILSVLISSVLGLLGRLVTTEFISFLIMEGAKILAAKTDNKHDDEIVAKMAEILGRKPSDQAK